MIIISIYDIFLLSVSIALHSTPDWHWLISSILSSSLCSVLCILCVFAPPFWLPSNSGKTQEAILLFCLWFVKPVPFSSCVHVFCTYLIKLPSHFTYIEKSHSPLPMTSNMYCHHFRTCRNLVSPCQSIASQDIPSDTIILLLLLLFYGLEFQENIVKWIAAFSFYMWNINSLILRYAGCQMRHKHHFTFDP